MEDLGRLRVESEALAAILVRDNRKVFDPLLDALVTLLVGDQFDTSLIQSDLRLLQLLPLIHYELVKEHKIAYEVEKLDKAICLLFATASENFAFSRLHAVQLNIRGEVGKLLR